MADRPRAVPIFLFCGVCWALPATRQAAAQSVESFYNGRTVTMLVGTAPGGINDISARLVARHLSRFIPGTPNIIVQNNPGAGGLVTANRLYFNSEKDGSVLAKLERAVPQLAIQGNPNAQFDPAKFTWLGSLSSYADDAYLMLVNANHPAKTIADLKTPGMSVALGADNAASSNLIFAVIAKEVLGLNVNVVRGYTGAAPLFLAMQRGELDGQMVGLELGANRPARSLEQECVSAAHGVRPHPAAREFPNMPIGRELTSDPDALSLIEFAELPFFMALPFAGAARRPGRSRHGAAKRVHGDVPGPGLPRRSREARHRHESDRWRRDPKLLARTAATPKDVIARYNAIGGAKN